MIVVGVATSLMEDLHFSFFISARDNQPKPVVTTWSDLAESLAEPRAAACTPETCKRSECTEKHGHAWSPAVYGDSAQRARNAVQMVSALVLDIDHVASDEDLAAILDRIPYERIIHGSHSDKPGDRCIRVVVRLSKPVPGNLWPQFWHVATKLLDVPVDQATKDASRLYFLPSRPQGATTTEFGDGTDYLYASTPGPALDVDALLSTVPEAPAAEPGNAPGVGAAPTFSIPSSDATGRARALEVLAHAWPQTHRHQASFALAGALAHAGYQAEDIAQFLHDLMDLVYGPGKDPSYQKREEQARASHAKHQAGEAVAGWPSLGQHLQGGEQTVQEVTQALGISGKPSQRFMDLVGKLAANAKPSHDKIVAHYRSRRTKLLRSKDEKSQYHARLISRVLDHEQPAEGDEDPINALSDTVEALLTYEPDNITDEQIANLLAHVFPLSLGQDADRSWSDTLVDIVVGMRTRLIQEQQEGNTFEMETSGQRVGKPKNIVKNIDVALKQLSVKLRFDLFADKKLISRHGLPWEIVEDRHIDQVWFDMEQQWDLQFGYEKFAKYLGTLARANAFHPVHDYLDSLEWDGTSRLDAWLVTYGQAADTEYTRAVGRLVLVAAVRRVRQPGCKFDEMLILEGEQGVLKSSALRALCPKGEWFTDDMPLHADSKRVIESTAGKWIIECGELRGMSKADIANLKGFLSRQTDESRMAFGRETKRAPRQWVPIGTTNDAQYLRDPTGLRRFLPVAVVQFDIDALLRDRDQLWAEAAHYEAQGESIRLDPRYYGLAAAEQEERRVVDTIEAIIESAFANHTGKIRSLDVYQLLGKDPVDVKPDEQRRVGDAMRRLGWRHSRRRINGKPEYVFMKGDKDDEAMLLAVAGRKVVRAQEANPPVPLTPAEPKDKVN